jgi:hypothetical protein
MDSLVAGAEEILFDTLNFSLPKTAGYIVERKFSTFQTEGSNAYSAASGTKIVRFRLASEGWLDPSTVRFFFDVVNTHADTTAMNYDLLENATPSLDDSAR